MTCNECRYHAADGTCRRFPPGGRPTCWPTVHALDWCGEFQSMKQSTPPPPPPQPVIIPEITKPLMEQLEEGVAPKIRFQKVKKTENLKEIQESPLFPG